MTAADLGVDLTRPGKEDMPPPRPGDWLEYSPVLTAAGHFARLARARVPDQEPVDGRVSNLNTYNFFFLMRRCCCIGGRATSSTPCQRPCRHRRVLIQFPLYGAIAAMLTQAKSAGGRHGGRPDRACLRQLTTQHTFPIAVGIYSAVLGLFIPSGGGKWLLEAPYVMQAANELKVHLGWTVQIYNAAEALPNLINPF